MSLSQLDTIEVGADLVALMLNRRCALCLIESLSLPVALTLRTPDASCSARAGVLLEVNSTDGRIKAGAGGNPRSCSLRQRHRAEGLSGSNALGSARIALDVRAEMQGRLVDCSDLPKLAVVQPEGPVSTAQGLLKEFAEG